MFSRRFICCTSGRVWFELEQETLPPKQKQWCFQHQQCYQHQETIRGDCYPGCVSRLSRGPEDNPAGTPNEASGTSGPEASSATATHNGPEASRQSFHECRLYKRPSRK